LIKKECNVACGERFRDWSLSAESTPSDAKYTVGQNQRRKNAQGICVLNRWRQMWSENYGCRRAATAMVVNRVIFRVKRWRGGWGY